MNIIYTFNPEKVTDKEATGYRKRRTVRAVVFDNNNNIAIIHVKKKGFYELPGGGIEEGETPEQAILRECIEEIGCVIKLETPIGKINEYRQQENLYKETYCYKATVVGDKGIPTPMEDESDLEMEVLWVTQEKAIEIIKSPGKSTSYIGEFAVERDILFIESAK